MIIAVDFDDTLMDRSNVLPGYRMGQPTPGAVLAMQRLAKSGHTLVVFTARNVQIPSARKAILDWCAHFQIPVHEVTNIKRPEFELMLDNRGLHFSDWTRALHDITVFESSHPRNSQPETQGFIKDITKPLTDPQNLL